MFNVIRILLDMFQVTRILKELNPT
jgi:hypothetical protein